MTEVKRPDGDQNDAMHERACDLRREGFSLGEAWGKASLEQRVHSWPAGWGDDLSILIYGDFDPPEEDLHIPELRITVHQEKLENTVIRSAKCVLKATVAVDEKSVAALIEAGRRINILLGASTLVNWGNAGSGWWSYVTHGTGGGLCTTFDQEDIHRAITGIWRLRADVRQRIDAALYWVREPRSLLREFPREDLLRVYSAYWNAFECLVEAVLLLHPKKKLSKSGKQERIDKFIESRKGPLTSKDIEDCYREIVNPGLVPNASHALRVCFGNDASPYIDECFKLSIRANRLYDIRNSINHGTVDAENPEELLRIESRLERLQMIVLRMFGQFVPFSAPTEPPPLSREPESSE